MATRIIVCDDHPVFRSGLVAALVEERDIELVGEVGTLSDLRTMLGTADVDLILLDVEMPDGSGVDALAEVVGQAPVVMVSAHDHPVLVRRALHAGALGYIRKDAEPAEVLRLVRRAAAGKVGLSGGMAMRLAESLRGGPDQRSLERSIEKLSRREREVVGLIAEGKTNRQIASQLFLSQGTVKNHVTRILEAFEVGDRTNLAILLVKHQLRAEGSPR